MSIWSTAADLLPGLKPGAFRGVTFHVPDISVAVGRRVLLTWFPGLDAPALDDFGASDGRVTVRGLILGDDYVTRALALQAAFRTAGPGTLLHPWLGEMQVVVPEDGAQISFSDGELRLVRFDVTFLRAETASPFGGSTLGGLLSAASALVSVAATFGWRAMGGPTIAVSTWSAAVATSAAIGAVVATACAGAPAAAVLEPALEESQAALETALAAGSGTEAAAAIAASLTGLSTPVAEAALGGTRAAIGPGGDAVEAAAALAPAAGAQLLLDIAGAMRAVDALGAPAAAARLCARLAALAQAVRVAADIAYESRQAATAWHAQLDAALELAGDDAATVAADLAAEAAPVWGALADLRGALARDLNEVIGRLPAVRLVTPAGTVSAWLIAHGLAGEDPAQVVGMLDDIVARNRLRCPGAVPPEPLEVLL
ncbi:DNA circularization N-terminal domain-containing protein [Xanthobacter sp. KR7-225]|uniref:DNA circularization N-terminal domain-containing protein n=1 Tax=Xanthobacter sp. KR7-225 TaxID=3156613 RepID=UPI0032B61255